MSLLDDVGGAFADLGDLAAPAVLSRITPGAYDPATGTNAAGTTQTCPCLAVLDASQKGLGYVFGDGLVQSGDLSALIPAKGLTFDPAPGDSLAVAGSAFSVIGVVPTFSGATPVLFKMLVRR